MASISSIDVLLSRSYNVPGTLVLGLLCTLLTTLNVFCNNSLYSLDPFLLVTFFFRVFFSLPSNPLSPPCVHALVKVLLVFHYLLRFTWVMSVNVDGRLYSAAIDFTCLFDRVSTRHLHAGPSDVYDGRLVHMVVRPFLQDFSSVFVCEASLYDDLPYTFVFEQCHDFPVHFPQCTAPVPHPRLLPCLPSYEVHCRLYYFPMRDFHPTFCASVPL